METREYKLTDVCDFQGGTQPPKEEWITEPRDGYVRMLQIRDFTQDKLEHVGYVKDTKKLNKCEEDDILIGRYGASVGKILTGLSGAYNVAIIKTIPNEELLSKRYLYYVLTGTDFQSFILNIGARAAQAGFNKSDLSLFKLHIPTSLEDQERIADVLEKAKNLIEKREKSIDLLDKFLEMKFLEMFVFSKTKMKDYTFDSLKSGKGKTFSNGPFGSDLLSSELTNEGVPVVYIRDIRNGYFEWKSDVFVSKEKAASLPNCEILANDILIAKVGDPPGISAIYPELQEPAIMTQDVIRLRLNRKLAEPNYVNYYLNSELGKRLIQRITVSGTRSRFSLGDFKKSIIPVPDINLQLEFTAIVGQTKKLREIVSINNRKIQLLYDSLCQKALKGELEISKKAFFEGTIKVEPKISGEVIVIDKINNELEEFHKNQPHTGAPDEIDNTIRQLEAELKVKGEIPFWGEYVKYRIVKGKFKEAFTFDQLWEEITKFPFETVPEYDVVSSMLFKWLTEENAFIRQQFNESTKQIELIVNETAKA